MLPDNVCGFGIGIERSSQVEKKEREKGKGRGILLLDFWWVVRAESVGASKQLLPDDVCGFGIGIERSSQVKSSQEERKGERQRKGDFIVGLLVGCES